MSEFIKISHGAGVMTIAMARPEKKNALTAAMYDAMIAALDRAETDDSTGAVLLHGEGGLFTAGNDIADFLATTKDISDFGGLRFVRRIAAFDKPLVAAVEGVAMGVGTTMLFHCDLVYAAPSAQFRMPFVDLALVPEAGASLLVPRRVGMARATEFLMLAEPFDAARALDMGIVNEVIAPDALLAHALGKARKLADKPREALLATRRLIRGDKAEIVARIDEEAREFGRRMASEEARGVFLAFMSKSKK